MPVEVSFTVAAGVNVTPCALKRMLGVHWNGNILRSCSHIVVVTHPVVSRFRTQLFFFSFALVYVGTSDRTGTFVECL